MKKKKDCKGFVENEELESVMGEISEAARNAYIETRRKQFEKLYDDVSLVKVESGHALTEDEKDDIIKSLNRTFLKNRWPVDIFTIDDRVMVFLASKKFKEVAERMQPGVKVVYQSELSEGHPLVTTVKSALYYAKGIPLIDIQYDKDAINYAIFDDPQGSGPSHAAYWRPMEEEK